MPHLKIENKHTYLGVNTTVDGNVLTPTATAVRQTNTMFRFFEPSWPVQGTDEDDRIGRKIMTTSIVSEGFLGLRTGNTPNTLGDVFDGYMQELIANGQWGQNYTVDAAMFPVIASIRHMIVEFDPDVITGSNATQYDLFRQWFVSLNIQTGTDLMPSNRMHIKRESTDFTGKFKILYDDVYYLSFKNPQVHFKVNQPYKRYLNFNSTTVKESPTNKRVYELFIGPTNVNIDYASKGFGDHLLATSGAEADFTLKLANLQFTMKLNYIDV